MGWPGPTLSAVRRRLGFATNSRRADNHAWSNLQTSSTPSLRLTLLLWPRSSSARCCGTSERPRRPCGLRRALRPRSRFLGIERRRFRSSGITMRSCFSKGSSRQASSRTTCGSTADACGLRKTAGKRRRSTRVKVSGRRVWCSVRVGSVHRSGLRTRFFRATIRKELASMLCGPIRCGSSEARRSGRTDSCFLGIRSMQTWFPLRRQRSSGRGATSASRPARKWRTSRSTRCSIATRGRTRRSAGCSPLSRRP